MTAERLVKNFERMVIRSEWLKKISNGRPERLVKSFERMVITAERLKKLRTIDLNG